MPVIPISVDIPDGPVGHRRASRVIGEVISRTETDVVHAHGLRAGIDAARAARSRSVPVITTIHNLVQPEIAGRVKARLYRFAEPLVVRLSDVTLAVSQDIADSLPAGSGRVEVLHLGIGETPKVTRTAASIKAEHGIPDGAPVVVTVARIAPQKALHVMLASVARLSADVHLMVLGEGPSLAEIKELATSLGIGERVHFLGFRDDVPDHVAAGDVFCLSSIWEGVPLAAQEAILLGTPIVATRVGGMGELIEDATSGWLVPRDDPAALADALRSALSDRDEATRRARLALAGLKTEFSTSAMIERLAALYQEFSRAR